MDDHCVLVCTTFLFNLDFICIHDNPSISCLHRLSAFDFGQRNSRPTPFSIYFYIFYGFQASNTNIQGSFFLNLFCPSSPFSKAQFSSNVLPLPLLSLHLLLP